ncbi:MAG: VOC family protein [Gemmatimonadaceae bacterium]
MTSDSPVPPGAPERGKPESFRGRTLSASLTVRDMQKSMAWYRDVVGFTVDEEYERDGRPVAVSLKAGAVKLLLNQDDGAKGERVKGEGFSVYITTAQNIDELANRVKAAGGTLESDPFDMPWGARVFRLNDPDGFRLVIASERE